MNSEQIYNVLSAHPDVRNLRHGNLNRLRFDFDFEVYDSGGGGMEECTIELFSTPGVHVFYYLGSRSCLGDMRLPGECADDERIILAGKFSPQTLCDALAKLIRCAHRYKRSDDSQSFYIGDERLCRTFTAILGSDTGAN